LPNFQRRKAKI